ncbi:MAG: glycosyltransferase family 39 protein [Methanomicrobium sp.]|nr:glycosyltransferase family 39 protein [Methanomicrobium sp.]
MGKKENRKESKDKKKDHVVPDAEKYQINSFKDLNSENLKGVLTHNRYAWMLIGLVIFGFALRFYNLGFNSIWLDEGTTLGYARMGYIQIWSSVMAEFHPPLFYWLEHIMMVFGESEFTLRVIPALCGVLSIPVFYLIGREIVNRDVGIISALLVTVSPFVIYYSQDARSYTMILLFFSISLLCYMWALKTRNMKWWILFGLTSAIAFWAHYYTIIGTGVVVLHAVFTQYKYIQNDPAFRKAFAGGIIAFIVVSIPLLMVLYQRYLALSASAPTYGVLGLSLIIESFKSFSGFNLWITVFFVVLFAIGVLYLFSKNASYSLLLLGLLVLPIIISVILSAKITMNPRYLIFVLPAYYIGIAACYVPIRNLINNEKLIYVLMAFLVLINIPFMAGYYTQYSKNDWRGFSQGLSSMTDSGVVIVVLPGYMTQPLNYYYSNTTDETIELTASSGENLENINKNYGNTTRYYIMTSDIYAANPEGDAVAWLETNSEIITRYMGIYLLKSK